jgi:hypothetical protein
LALRLERAAIGRDTCAVVALLPLVMEAITSLNGQLIALSL